MCGRFVISDTASELVALFDIDEQGEILPDPSWNVSPTEQIPVVVESNRNGPVVRRLESARWSLVPGFAKELKLSYPTFNARAESVTTTPSFRDSLASRRAIIPATGYYEWRTTGRVKTPHFIHPPEGPLAFAGLYSWWRDPAKAPGDPARWVLSATILTTDATGGLAALHSRAPVMIPAGLWSDWLDPGTVGGRALVDAAVSASHGVADRLRFHEVGTVRGDGPELIRPAGEAAVLSVPGDRPPRA